jgi:hypothetical protein
MWRDPRANQAGSLRQRHPDPTEWAVVSPAPETWKTAILGVASHISSPPSALRLDAEGDRVMVVPTAAVAGPRFEPADVVFSGLGLGKDAKVEQNYIATSMI